MLNESIVQIHGELSQFFQTGEETALTANDGKSRLLWQLVRPGFIFSNQDINFMTSPILMGRMSVIDFIAICY